MEWIYFLFAETRNSHFKMILEWFTLFPFYYFKVLNDQFLALWFILLVINHISALDSLEHTTLLFSFFDDEYLLKTSDLSLGKLG